MPCFAHACIRVMRNSTLGIAHLSKNMENTGNPHSKRRTLHAKRKWFLASDCVVVSFHVEYEGSYL